MLSLLGIGACPPTFNVKRSNAQRIMRTFFVVLVLAAVALGFTNPGMEDFRAFAREQVEADLSARAGDSRLGQALARAGTDLAADNIHRVTDRTNYLVASTYAVDLDRQIDTPPDWRFLGIAGRFIPLKTPEDEQG
jgi:hypothetical protein